MYHCEKCNIDIDVNSARFVTAGGINFPVCPKCQGQITKLESEEDIKEKRKIERKVFFGKLLNKLSIILIITIAFLGYKHFKPKYKTNRRKIPKEDLIFQQLIKKRKFREIESRIETMQNNFTDPLKRAKIMQAFYAMENDIRVSLKAVPKWCKKYPNSYIAFTAKGLLHINMAWRYRGGGYANSVSDDKWKKFHGSLKIAEEALTKAYNLNPEFFVAPSEMITVALGLSYPRQKMEIWFTRAIDAHSEDEAPYKRKLLYLQPKWHGSVKELLDFVYQIDNDKTPTLIRAIAYGESWMSMPSRNSDLLTNKKFLSKAALAYDRSSKKYPHRRVQRKLCAYFAIKAGNYKLAAKHFKKLSWKNSDASRFMWESKRAFKSDKAMALSKS